ncbi:EppA_BapA family protein [uncultured Paludibacter sp.]|uniref:EppA_BapA family protein n=1 Tax=uncultured Paludibacter sp. TaxID=497635 RepID=A0A653AC81_9BACT|nr:EppA_BapA family protein [uncultured Paludibacter sp.]
MRRITVFSLLIIFALNTSVCYSKNKKIASFPFEMLGSYVVVNVKINNSSPLKLILDSGIKNTLITELFEDDNIELNYTDTVEMQGLGDQHELKALRSKENVIKVGKLLLKKSTVYFLPDNIFNLSMILGQKVNGILGSDIFRNYVVDINYGLLKVNIFAPESYEAPSKYEWLPMEVSAQNKMFIYVDVKEENSEDYKRVKVLLDTGAEASAWFQTVRNENRVKIPEKHIYGVIGEGLNGEILGNFSRLKELCIGSYCIPNPIVAFPDSISIMDAVQLAGRDGSVGSQILKRFNMIFDYQNKRFYFVKNHFFRDPFQYNVSGLELVQDVLFFPVFRISKVWKNSKAEKAGIKPGDIIFEVDNEKTYFKSLSEIKKIFSTPSRRPLKLLIKRDDDFMTVMLDMKDEL